jgi:SAM-dependent methyltransferase
MIRQLERLCRASQRVSYSHLLSGERVYCPLCNWRGRCFIRGNVCPGCGSMARHRLIPYAIQYFGLDFSRGGLLHIGPNMKEVAYVLNRFVPSPYYRHDVISKPMINLPGDMRQIPLPDGSVDFGLIWHVLEHIPEDRKAIQEMYRVLRAAGKFLVSVPITPPDRERTYEDPSLPREKYLSAHGHHDHVRSCGLDYIDRARDVGFSISTLRVKEHVTGPDKEFFGLSDSHVAWCCHKPLR